MQAVALLSGGIDSTVATWWALSQGWQVTGLTFHYRKRPPPEVEATRTIAELAGLELVEIDLPWMAELADPVHPLLDNAALTNAEEGYVPARNAIFYSIAAHHAELLGASAIVGGHNGTDPEAFPDAAPSFFEGLAELLQGGLASGMDLSIRVPLAGKDKLEVVDLGLELDAPLELCWSCYEQGPEPCRVCPSCEDRAQAYDVLGVRDPQAPAAP